MRYVVVFLDKEPGKAAGRQIGMLVVLPEWDWAHGPRNIEERGTATFEMSQICLGLASYRSEFGEYPEDLSKLSPKYMPELPLDDWFQDGPYGYRREGDAYVLYSFDLDGDDDNGVLPDNLQNGDIPIRPVANAPQKEDTGRK